VIVVFEKNREEKRRVELETGSKHLFFIIIII
jgi:hypothetical protein